MSHRKDAVIIQWSSGPYKQWLRLTMQRHLDYAERHQMDCWLLFGEARPEHPLRPVNYEKAHLIRQALLAGYETIIAMDSDVLIVGNEDLRNAVPEQGFGAVWHAMEDWGSDHGYDHYNIGVLYVRSSNLVMQFINDWLCAEDAGHPWRDQHIFNQLCWTPRYQSIVQQIDRRWHSTIPNHASEDPNPQVVAWHGGGSVEARLQAMQDYLSERAL
jgi:hypothetical protein